MDIHLVAKLLGQRGGEMTSKNHGKKYFQDLMATARAEKKRIAEERKKIIKEKEKI